MLLGQTPNIKSMLKSCLFVLSIDCIKESIIPCFCFIVFVFRFIIFFFQIDKKVI